ncbi:GNAT family N-acetyltransferase [Patescibacteria group bacterium]|nr:GNAT family N-acetyltransferase [Patescibacteria group bacterium]MBU1472240.1 GNAT family N-acetyltransferase [Patescibacteria group bacterium]MBU2460509.1 GNAT family N-acetyltransferase [Patescibacteria group bacterium]
MSTEIHQDINKAILIVRDAGRWLKESGKNPSKWWLLKNLNKKFLLKYAKPEEFYVALVDNKPAAAAVLQFSQKAQDWKSIDKDKLKSVLYIHWLCVHRKFAGKGFPKIMVDFAEKLAKEKNVKLLRADTNAKEMKLRKIYEDLGFNFVGVEQENYRHTAFFQKKI